jgi:class 3 adenylate cyclase
MDLRLNNKTSGGPMSKTKERTVAGKWRSSCMSALNIIYYFHKHQDVPVEKLMDGLSVEFNYIDNISNWLSWDDSARLFLNAVKNIKGFSHTDWVNAGNMIYKGKTSGYFKMLFKLLPIDTIYLNVPKYAKHIAGAIGYEIVSASPGKIILRGVSKLDFNGENLLGCECSYSLGIIKAVARVKDEIAYSSEAAHEICSMKADKILSNYYGMDKSNFSYRVSGLFINGLLYARYIKLNPRDDNPEYLGRAGDHCGCDESNAVVFIKDFMLDGVRVFSAGDVYNAPYCVFRINYKKKFFVGGRVNNRKMVLFLEEQLEMTEEKFKQAITAKKELLDSMKETERRDEIISVYMRDSIYHEIKAGKNPLEYKPQKKSLSIMFTDIRNFVTMTEELEPITIIEFLNSYFFKINRTIIINGGEIDKLIGDGVMALFTDCNSAVTAALQMQRILKTEGRSLLTWDWGELKAGTGINFDEVVEGNLGTVGTKLERTIIGDGVNLASRLESLTKHYHTDVIISDFVREELTGDFKLRYLDTITVKGKSRPLAIYEVIDEQDSGVVEFKLETLKNYKKAVSFYRAGNFKSSLALFTDLNSQLADAKQKDSSINDPMIDIYIKRLLQLDRYKDDASFLSYWDGVFRHTDK